MPPFASPPEVGSSRSLVHPHRREVSYLSGRAMLQLVSLPLQEGLRFVPPPYPHRHQLALSPPYLVTFPHIQSRILLTEQQVWSYCQTINLATSCRAIATSLGATVVG